MAGDARGVVERDLDKSADYLSRARKGAMAAGNPAFAEHIDAPLNVLKSEGITIPE